MTRASGRNILKKPPQLPLPPKSRQLLKLPERPHNHPIIISIDRPNKDLRVLRLGNILALGVQLFEELLTRPHAGENDVDVVEWLEYCGVRE